MRLIDADALIEAIWKNHKETEELFDVCVDELKEVYCGVVTTIDEQPTAYDVEKVEEELREADEGYWWMCGGGIDCKTAIDIMKRGGIDG